MQYIDLEQFMRAVSPGTMVYGRVNIGAGWETALYVREESKRIRALGPHPRMEWRVALLMESGIALVPILLRLARNPREPEVY